MKNLTISAAVALGLATSLGSIFGYLFHAGFGESRNVAAQAVFEAKETQRVLQAYEPIFITSKFYDELASVKSIQDADALRERYRVATLRNIAFFESQAARLELPNERSLAAPFLEKAMSSRKALETK
jgi:hypothetical protein